MGNSLMKQVEVVREKVTELDHCLVNSHKLEKDYENKVRILQSEYKEIISEQKKLNKSITSEESSLERLRGKLNEIFQKARVEETQLPLIKHAKKEEEENRNAFIS